MQNIRLAECALRLGMVYLVIGMILGAVMGMQEDFSMRDVHAHLNLLGFVSTFLIGLFLKIYPHAADQLLTRASVLLSFVSVPVMLGALALFYLGHTQFGPVLGISSLVVVLAYILFMLAVFRATAR